MSDTSPTDITIKGLEDLREIGVGGFATVYVANQPAFRRTVAVKVLQASNLDEQAEERFNRECEAMGSLSEHPNIVTIYDNGFTENPRRPYLLMAHLPGGSLQDRLDATGPFSWQDATMIGVHLAGALETAHRGDVIHRDIKPANVLMSSFGDAQLTDFGIARISGGHETRSGVITASMAHAPPEILDGQKPTRAADIYSLGSTIFELIYGKPAFENPDDESMVPMLRRILSDPPPDLRERGVPDEIATVLERSMAKDLTQRQQSAVQLGRELQAARRNLGLDPGKLTVPAEASLDLDEGEQINFVAATSPTASATAPVLPPSPSATAATQAVPVGAAYAGADEKKRSTGLLVGIAVLVVLVVAAGVGVVMLSRGSTNTASSTTVPTTQIDPNATPVNDYTQQVESNFFGACLRGKGASPQYCRCVFGKLKATFSYEKFTQLEREVREKGAAAVPELEKIKNECTAPPPDPGATPS